MSAVEMRFDKKTLGSSVAQIFSSAIKEKTILITGVSPKGLGGSLAEIISSQSPKNLVLASRTLSKIQEVIGQLKPRFQDVNYIAIAVDLSSQQSCRHAASTILSDPQIKQIDILINNAAIMSIPNLQLSPEGIEMQFATNHIGHFLFTNLVMPKILAAAESNPSGTTRIVNISSRAVLYSPIRFSDLNFEKPHGSLPQSEQPGYAALADTGRTVDPTTTYSPPVAYGQSKTANVLFSLELTERLYGKYGIMSFAVHPGALLTELIRYSDPKEVGELIEKFKGSFKSLDEGASTPLVAALDNRLDPGMKVGSGFYLSDCQIADAPEWALSRQYARDLWKLSEDIVKETFHH